MKALLVADIDQTLLQTHVVGHELWQLLCRHFQSEYPFQSPEEFLLAASDPDREFSCFLETCGLSQKGITWEMINTYAANYTEHLHATHATWFENAYEMLQEIDADADIELGFATNNIAPAFRKLFCDKKLDHVPLHDSLETHFGRHKPNPDMILDHISRHSDVTTVVVLGDSLSDLQAAARARAHTTVEIHAAWAEYGSYLKPHHVENQHNPDLHLQTTQDLRDLPQKIRELLTKKR